MRVLILSDIHANRTALEMVLSDAGNFEAVWCLGDLVGYGPDPNQCVNLIQSLPNLICLIGNHDQAALGLIPRERFNADAQAAITWTEEKLTDPSRKFLAALSGTEVHQDFTLAHGSPRRPIWEYIISPKSALVNFETFGTNYALVGHSHLPLAFKLSHNSRTVDTLKVEAGHSIDLEPRMILNPGSVGQPRDFDPRAAYALLDTDEMTWESRRVAYDINDVQVRILQSGLPERQAMRLVAGW
jgi:diadenosine tetraphosphatase ApaH/serine/threonine PP2A family protein phosphatase